MAENPFETAYRWPHGQLGKPVVKDYDKLAGEMNQMLLDLVLKQLHKLRMRERNLYTGDHYFIFSGAPKSRCSFNLTRTLPGWKFGLWLEGQLLLLSADDRKRLEIDDDTPVIRLFCQHESAIDKFKPSRSPIAVDISLKHVLDMLYGGLDEQIALTIPVQRVALAIKHHPFMVYTENVDVEYPPTNSLIVETVRYATSWYWHAFCDDLVLRREILRAKRLKAQMERVEGVEEVILRHETPGKPMHSFPPVETIVCFSEDVDVNDALDAAWEVYRTPRHGRISQWSEASLTEVLCGKDDKRGYYDF